MNGPSEEELRQIIARLVLENQRLKDSIKEAVRLIDMGPEARCGTIRKLLTEALQ